MKPNAKVEAERSLARGRLTEDIVELALIAMQLKKEIWRYEKIDRPGEDFSFTLKRGKTITFEVKSSRRGKKRHKSRGYTTPVIVVNNKHTKINMRLIERFKGIAKGKIRALIREITKG